MRRTVLRSTLLGLGFALSTHVSYASNPQYSLEWNAQYAQSLAATDTTVYLSVPCGQTQARIMRYNSAGDSLGEWGFCPAPGEWCSTYLTLLNPRVASGTSPANEVFVLDPGTQGKAIRYTGTGLFLSMINCQLDTPASIAVDELNRVFVTSLAGYSLSRYSDTFAHESTFYVGPPPQTVATNALAAANGHVYVGTREFGSNANKILKYSDAGTLVDSWGGTGSGLGEFSGIGGIAVDDSGWVYVADIGNNRVQVFREDGEYVASWGTPGSGPCKFNAPLDVAIDGTANVYVLDSTFRVQKFENPSQCVTLVAFPPSPYPLTSTQDGPLGPEHTVELRAELVPGASQGLHVFFSVPADCLCPCEDQPEDVEVSLRPRSGTGPVIPCLFTGVSGESRQYSAYFLINELTSPGFYDLHVICPGGVESDVFTNVRYLGYAGYVPSGTLYNELTGNVIRGASVSIWRELSGGSFQLVEGMLAGDGTYFFDVPSGTYKILVQYDLGGEQWRGPFEVNSPVPYEDIYLTPVTSDTDAPELSFSNSGDCVTGEFSDASVGIAVLEVVPGSAENVVVGIDQFLTGAGMVGFSVCPDDPDSSGSVELLCVDQLGNQVVETIPVGGITGVQADSAPRKTRLLVQPNPSRRGTLVSFDMPAPGNSSLRVYDIAGRMVRVIADGWVVPGTHQVFWDGKDESGEPVTSGVYFVQHRTDRITESLRVLIVR